MTNNVRFIFDVGDSPHVQAVYTWHCARQIEWVSLNTIISSVVKREFTKIQVNMLTWRGYNPRSRLPHPDSLGPSCR
jgi:hypothetical protein